MRVGPATLISIGAIAALVALAVTVQILPETDARTPVDASVVAARAMGTTAYVLLAIEVGLGLVLSHPNNITTWHATKQIFPWHEMVTVFAGAFIALHVALLAVDPYAKVGVIGALVPGYSEYRPVAVAIGSIALYALIVTAVTAKWTHLLPSGLVAEGPPVRGRRVPAHLDPCGPRRHRRRGLPAALCRDRHPDPRGRRTSLVDGPGPAATRRPRPPNRSQSAIEAAGRSRHDGGTVMHRDVVGQAHADGWA